MKKWLEERERIVKWIRARKGCPPITFSWSLSSFRICSVCVCMYLRRGEYTLENDWANLARGAVGGRKACAKKD